MFDIGLPEFMVLAIVALFVFGPDRLPQVARQAARGLRTVRNMATNARRDFKRELGPEFDDFELEDLNPRRFVKRHVLDGVEDDFEDVRRGFTLSNDDLLDDTDSGRRARRNGHSVDADHASIDQADEQFVEDNSVNGTATASAHVREGVSEPPPFDPEAT